MIDDPIVKFIDSYKLQFSLSTDIIPSACCFSTIGTDGYPNARFVSLKEVKDNAFIITGPVDSRKGVELTANAKAALTFWWPAVQKQVRIQGDVSFINATDADRYFSERDRESCIVSLASKQGEVLESLEELNTVCRIIDEQFKGQSVPRPDNWGGFCVAPVRIEFMEFKENRFHERVLYLKDADGWSVQSLQP